MSIRRKGYDDYGDKMPLNNTFGKFDRIDTWWKAAFKAKISNMLDEYFNCLEAINIEISFKLTPDELEQTKSLIRSIERLLDKNAVPSGMSQLMAANLRRGSNLCDELAYKLTDYCARYEIEYFDLKKWGKEKRDSEPVMRG